MGWAAVVAASSALTLARVEAGPSSPQALQQRLDQFAQRARPGLLGIAVVDLASGANWQVNGRIPFPMMSVFKVPLAAAVLDRADRGELSLDRRVVLTRSDLRTGRSAIADHFRGETMSFSVRELIVAAVSRSDNTAADALLRVVGGPGVVTAFLRAHGIEGVRVDRGEGEIAAQFGLEAARGPPRDEPSAVRLARLRRGFAAYLADPRDRATPLGAANLLRTLWQRRLLSKSSTQWLLDLMAQQTVPSRLRAGLPSGVRLADRCGTSYSFEGRTAAYNDMGILTWPDGHAVIIAAFLMDSAAPERARERLFAELARTVAE